MQRRINVGLHFLLQICHLQSLICLVKNRHFECHKTISFEPPEGGIFAASGTLVSATELKNYIKPFKINSELWTIKLCRVLRIRCPDMINGGSPSAAQILNNNVFANSFPLTLVSDSVGEYALPLRGWVSAGGLMARKQKTKKVKGAEKTKRVSKIPLSCRRENRMWT